MNRNESPSEGDPRIVNVEVRVTNKGSLNEALAKCVDAIRENLGYILIVGGSLVLTLGPSAWIMCGEISENDEKPVVVDDKAPITPEK